MKLLFLDIDGVLCSTRSAAALGDMPHGFERMELFDQVALGLIRRLGRNGVNMVLSSSWRLLHPFQEVAQALDLPIIAAVPNDAPGIRGKQIKYFLDNWPMPVDRYAIVDDDVDMLPEQARCFVRTSNADGLLWYDYLRLCEVLDVAPYDGRLPRGKTTRGTGRALKW